MVPVVPPSPGEVVIYQTDGEGDVPAGYVSSRRLKFAKPPPPRLIRSQPTQPDARERENTSSQAQATPPNHSFLPWGSEDEGLDRPTSGLLPLRTQQSALLIPTATNLYPPQLRPTASTSRLRSGTAGQRELSLREPILPSRPLKSTDHRRQVSGNSAYSGHSQETELTTSTLRKRHARDIFAEFGVSRPSGWLSDDDEEDFSRHQDGSNSIPAYPNNICHSCGSEVTSLTFCATCGHSVCPQCAGQASAHGLGHSQSVKQVVTTSEHRSRNLTEEESRSITTGREVTDTTYKTGTSAAPARASLKNNPFIVADKMTKISVVEPLVTDTTVLGSPSAKPSDCLPKHADRSPSAASHGNYGNPACDAMHAGHHTDRQSVVRLAKEPTGAGITTNTDHSRSHSPMVDDVQDKIDKLYHHSEDLVQSRHIMEHLAAGSAASGGLASRQTEKGTEGHREAAIKRSPAVGDAHPAIRDTAANSTVNGARQLQEWERSHSFDVDPVKKRGSDSFPLGLDNRLSDRPEKLSPSQAAPRENRLAQMETKSTPQMKSSGSLLGSPTDEPSIEWPKLKKVTKETATVVEPKKPSLPWLQRPLRRVPKEDNISERAKTHKSVEIESWRASLRKVDEPGSGSGNKDRGDRDRADTCTSCREETSRDSSASASEPTPVEAAPSVDVETKRETYLEPPLSRRVEEVRTSNSRNSSSETSTTRKVETETTTHVSRTVKETHSTSDVHESNGTAVAGQSFEATSQPSNNVDVNLATPVPIMPSNHTCFWKDRYVNLTAEVRQLKAEIISRERIRETIEFNEGDGELGVEGLTIVMHLKGKDDLVINTDLTRASSDV
ncbi:hypothetical protein CSOJ01_00479 [Colletotrichum sojae]|uniref:Uncharacterized protein n=1 Tax=Colletotrichum sojae TaxID=2175907 RepID=A0A8H6N5L5_9PEZI|nr:hypothetical protein CSOJ01_00479 [Colletotrichum sojae]